jgi:hypothetical protein
VGQSDKSIFGVDRRTFKDFQDVDRFALLDGAVHRRAELS